MSAALVPGFDQIDGQIRRWLESGAYRGAGLILARGGRTLFERYYGDHSAESVVEAGAAGQWVAAATIAATIDAGLLDWQAAAAHYVDGLNPMMGRATLRQLLAHTGGYPDRPAGDADNSAEAIEQIRLLQPDSAPGTRFRPGAPSLQMAARIAELAAGADWGTLFATRIADPLAMRASGFAPSVAGGFTTTARDMAHFLTMIADRGAFADNRVLSAEAIEELERDQVGGAGIPPGNYVERARAELRDDIYGLGLWREEVDGAGRALLISHPGESGAYPWVDRRTGSIGMFVASLDAARARAIGFDPALASPVIPWLARDAFADATAEHTQRGFVAVPGGKLYWEVTGDGPPLILIHGDGLDRTLWDPQVPALERHFRLVRYDLRGHGRSVPIDADESFLHAEDLVRLMDGLHIREAHLAGIALGGAVVVDMLALHPERMLSGIVAGADLDAPAPGADDRSDDLWQLKRDRLDRLTNHGGSRIAAVRAPLWRMLSKWQGPRTGTGKSPPILGEAAHALLQARAPDLPVLILTPELTAHRPSTLLPLLPRGRQEIIADTGYFANLEQPKAFDEALLRFLT